MRDFLIKALNEKGIPTAIYYPIPLNEQAAYKNCNVVSRTSNLGCDDEVNCKVKNQYSLYRGWSTIHISD